MARSSKYHGVRELELLDNALERNKWHSSLGDLSNSCQHLWKDPQSLFNRVVVKHARGFGQHVSSWLASTCVCILSLYLYTFGIYIIFCKVVTEERRHSPRWIP
jgi:hypothetical protein